MKKINPIILFSLLTLLLSSGCKTAETKSVKLSNKIISEIRERNPSFSDQIKHEELSCKFSIKEDKNGFHLYIYDSDFNKVTKFLNQIIGNPINKSINIDKNKHWLYSNKKLGIHLQVIDKKTEIFIVCLVMPPKSKSE
jgi:hypothetical protein